MHNTHTNQSYIYHASIISTLGYRLTCIQRSKDKLALARCTDNQALLNMSIFMSHVPHDMRIIGLIVRIKVPTKYGHVILPHIYILHTRHELANIM